MNNKSNFNLFFRLTKVDEAKRLVYGIATAEVPDKAGEIMDYETSKPRIQKWSTAALERTKAAADAFGPEASSLGNIRVQHSDEIGGKVIELNFLDAEKAVELGTYCDNDRAWDMIRKGLLTGFSVGGNYYGRPWRDPRNPKLLRYTADPVEFSYVDSPAVPTAMFTMIKTNGDVEMRKAVHQADLGDNPASVENLESNEVENAAAPGLVTVPSDEVMKNIPVVAGMHLSPEIIEQRGVEAINTNAPPVAPVRKEVDADTMQKFIDAVGQLQVMKQAEQQEQLKQLTILKSLGARVGINRRESAPLTAPVGLPANPHEYGDPVNFDYPMDLSHAATTLNKYNQGIGKLAYSPREWHTLGRRIAKLTKVLGVAYQYDPTKQFISKTEVQMTLQKADAKNLLAQLGAAMGVAVDQIGNDPAAIADLLMQALGSVDDAAVTSAAPEAPTGSQADARDTALKAAGSTFTTAAPGTPTPVSTDKTAAVTTITHEPDSSPSSSPSTPGSTDEMSSLKSSMAKMEEAQAAIISSLAQIAKAMTGEPQEIQPVQKSAGGIPLGDLAALVNAQQPEPKDEVLDILTSGSVNALYKAAVKLGTEKTPDVAGVISKANRGAMDSLVAGGRFTSYYASRYPGAFNPDAAVEA